MFFPRQAGKLVNCCLLIEFFLCLSCATARSGDLTADQISGSDPYVATVSRFLQKMSPKIINGNPAATGTYKWQTSLQVSWVSDPVQAHFCGGSLIAPGWVLTAGHCVDSLKATDFTVVAGTINLTMIGQRQTVARTLVHKDYFIDSSNIVAGRHPVNDVALVKLFTPFNMTGDLQIISLVDAAAEAPTATKGNLLSVTGFGATAVGGQATKSLMAADVRYVDRDSCNASASYDKAITDGMLCAGGVLDDTSPDFITDSCQGDSGGALTFHPLGADVKQVGVVGWGVGCGQPLKYGVYTRIAKYRDWIEACMTNPNQCPAK